MSWLADLTKFLPTPGYIDDSEESRKYKYALAVDRDNVLNAEEKRMYDDTATELEYGVGFLRRAHP